MATLSDADRHLAARQWVDKIHRELNNRADWSYTDIKAAVDAADAWADANAAAFNTALPAGFRTAANTAQKTLLLCYVILRRAGIF
jgi:hypothetical protein